MLHGFEAFFLGHIANVLAESPEVAFGILGGVLAVAVKLIGGFGNDLRAGGPGSFAMGIHIGHVHVQADGVVAFDIGGATAVFLAGLADENEAVLQFQFRMHDLPVRSGIFATGLEAKGVFQKVQARGGVVVIDRRRDARHVGGRILDSVAY